MVGAVLPARRPLRREPAGAGRHPVFVYLVATAGLYDGEEAKTFVEAMAARGFVAAAAEYDTLFGVAPEALDGKSACLFDAASSASAVSRLCARASADCTRGVVVAGFSQGAFLAARAHNHDPRVRGVYALGLNDHVMPAGYVAQVSPAPDGTRTLPASRLRIVDGAALSEWAGEQEATRAQLNGLTGSACAVTAYACLGPAGAGWYIVQHAQVADGSADHCYFHGGGGCSYTPAYDPRWAPPGAEPWSLATNLDWLAAQADVPVDPPDAGSGLTAAYFDDVEMTTPAVTRIEPAIDFDWVWGSPSPAIGGDTFAARWTGTIEPPASGTYTFFTQADDGVRLWVDGRLLVDDWYDHAPLERSGSIELTAGRRTSVRMEYYERYWGATARLLWSPSGQPKRVVPQTALFPDP